MAINLAEAKVLISGDRSKYKDELDKGERDTRSFGDHIGNILDVSIGVSLARLGASITAKLGQAIKAGLTAGFDLGAMYDEVADKLVVATGAQGAALNQLQDDFKAVFAAVPADIGTVGDTLVELNRRLGLTGEALQEVAIPMAEVSRLTGTDAATNVQVLTRLMGDWGVSADEAATTMDKLFKAQQLTGASMQTIARASVQYGAIMRQMGFTLDEAIALFAQWEQEGVNAELVMGSLRIAASEFAREGVPLAEGLKAVQEQIRNTTDSSEALNLAIEVFGARAGPDMAAAIREGRFEIEDLVTVLGDAEGAVMDAAEATNDWPELVARAGHRITNALEPIGTAFLNVANTVAEHVLPVIEGLADAIVPALEGVAGQAGTWGENIAVQLANGIASAAPYVIGAIQAIADVITLWMSPGSPPRMLPDLPEWGASAMQEFLDGFGEADFDVLKDFSRTVERLLEVKVGSGAMAEGDLVPALVGSRAGIAEALGQLRETGDVTEDVYARIREAAGTAGEEVEKFARLYVDSQRVEVAEAEKSKVAAEYAAKLSDARKRGASKSELDAIKKERKEALATANDRIRAAKDIDKAATDELSLEKLRLQAVADERDLYDQQIRTLGDFARGVASLSGAKEALKAVTDKAADAEWNYRFAVADTAGKIELLKEKLAGTVEGSEDYWRIKQQLATWEQRHADEMKGGAGAAGTLADSLQNLIDTYKNLGKAQKESSDGLHPALELLGPEYVGKKNPFADLFDMDAIKAQAEEVRQTIIDALMPEGEDGGVQWSALGTKIAAPLVAALGEEVRQKASSALFGGDEDKTWGDIGKELGRRVGNGIIEGIKETLPPGVQKLDLAFESWFGGGEETPEAPKVSEGDLNESLGIPPAATKGPTALERMWGGVTSWFEGVKSDLDSAFDSLIDKSDDADTSVSDLATNAETNLTTMSSGVAQHMQTTSDDWAAKWAQIDETHDLTWKDILQAASEGGIQLGADILANVNSILLLLQGKEPDWQTRGQGMMTSAAAGVDAKQQTLIDSILSPVEEAMRQIEELWEKWTPPWENETPPTTPPPTGGETPPGYATGTTYHPGGWAMVGEMGRELVKLPRGSEVFSAGQTAGMMAAAAPVTVNVGPVTVREDEDIQALAWRIVKEIERRR